MKITKHGEERLKQRCGFRKKTQERMAAKIYENGIPIEMTKGQLKKWLKKVYSKNTNADNLRVYGDNVYVFCEKNLVTVLFVPQEIKKNIKNMIISAEA